MIEPGSPPPVTDKDWTAVRLMLGLPLPGPNAWHA